MVIKKIGLQAKSTIPALNSHFLHGMGAVTSFSAKADVFCGVGDLQVRLTLSMRLCQHAHALQR